MKAIEFLKLLDKECLDWCRCSVIDGGLLTGDGYTTYFGIDAEPILWSYFKEHLTYFAYWGDDLECFLSLPVPALRIEAKDEHNVFIHIWIIED